MSVWKVTVRKHSPLVKSITGFNYKRLNPTLRGAERKVQELSFTTQYHILKQRSYYGRNPSL